MNLYPNRWDLVNQIEEFGSWWYIEITTGKWRVSKPVISCQYTKYQRVTDILNSLGIGVKVSFTIPDIFGVARTTGL